MSSSPSDDEDDFYTPGPPQLLDIRRSITAHSLSRAQSRLDAAYSAFKSFDPPTNLANRRAYYSSITESLSLQGTLPLSNRFVSSLALNTSNKTLAASAWDGVTYLVDPFTLQQSLTITPQSLQKISSSIYFDDTLITAGHDGFINLHKTSDNSLIKTISTSDRINSLQLHTSKNHFFSASADYTWSFYDLPTATQIYQQEGHTDSISSLAQHPDGSILASAGSDTTIKLWDLRSGNNIANFSTDPLSGHTATIHALDWRNNGFHLASAGADNQLLIWDIRSKSMLASLPNHTKVITSTQFSPNGLSLLSASYDGKLSISSTDNWSLVKSFQTLDKIMDAKFISDTHIITAGWDRSIKLYNTI